MLTYYHGTDKTAAENIAQHIDSQKGGGELGQSFYIGSSAWRAHSWAWLKAKRNYAVLKFEIDEEAFLSLKLLCLNRRRTQNDFAQRKKAQDENSYVYANADAVWAPIVGKNVKDAYQIKFQGGEGSPGEQFINDQSKTQIV